MQKYLRNPAVITGFGTLIVTLVIFFAQGGFGEMTHRAYLYLIGLIIGVGMIIYGIIKTASQDRKVEQRKQLREHYAGSRELPKLLWQVYERAEELVMADDRKDLVIAKIPDMDKTLTNSGYFSPSNVSLIEMQKFAQSFQNPLAGKVPELKSKKLKSMESGVKKTLLSIQGAIDAEGFGALKLMYADQGACKDLLPKIAELKIGLPDKIHQEIDGHILISAAIANLSYFGLPDKMPSQFKTLLPFFKPASDNIISEINSRISELIEAFLSGEDIK